MEVLGKSLESLRSAQHFSPLTIAQVGMQLVTAYESLHSFEYLHRDVKPDNLAVSLSSPTIFLVDFGIAAKYQYQGVHVKYGEKGGFVGNYTFCSVNVMQGAKPGRRDDLEAVGYVLVYLFTKNLPWKKINSRDQETHVKHMRRKTGMRTTELCSGIDPEYRLFLDYCKALNFDEKPDYGYLAGLMRKAAVRWGFNGTWDFDWQKKPTKSPHSRRPKHRSKPRKASVSAKMRRLNSLDPAPGTHFEELTTACSPEELGDSRPTLEGSGNTDPGRRRGLEVSTRWKKPENDDVQTPVVVNSLNIEAVRRRLKKET